MEQEYLVNIKTEQAFVFKHLSKILKDKFATFTLIITKKNIIIQESTDGSILVEVTLDKNNFIRYDFNPPKIEGEESPAVCLGLDSKEFFKTMKSMTKGYSLSFIIPKGEVNCIQLEMVKDSFSKSQRVLKLKQTKLCEWTSPIYRGDSTVTISTKTLKNSLTLAKDQKGGKLKITAQKSGIILTGPNQLVIEREQWGKIIPDGKIYFDKEISVTNILVLQHLAPLSSVVRIRAPSNDLPIKFSVNAESLGVVNIYINE